MAKGLTGLQGISEVARQEAAARDAGIQQNAAMAQQRADAFIRNNYLYNRITAPAFEQYIPLDVLPEDFGKSRFDSRVKTLEDVYNLDNFRAQEQGPIGQFINGVTKGLTTAGTTFVSGTLGTVYGIFNGLNKAFNQSEDNQNLNDAQEFLGGFVNNPVARTMQDFNNFMERWAPNYRSYEEQNTPWWKRLGTANFWADDIIKNVGFSIGSMGAALAWNGIGDQLSKVKFFKDAKTGIPAAADDVASIINNPAAGERIVQAIEQGTNLTKPLEYIRQAASKAGKAWTKNGLNIALSNLLGSTGEAQIEAIQASTDFRNSQLNKAKKYFTDTKTSRFASFTKNNPQYFVNGNLTPEGEQVWQQSEQNEFNTYKDQVEAEAIKMGNNIFLYQTALLTATNSYVYAKVFGAGYTTNSALARRGRWFIGAGKEKGKMVANESLAKWAKVGSRAFQGGVEAFEEMGQSFITKTSEDYFKHELADHLYYKDVSDPNYNKQTANFLNSLAVGLKGSFGSGEDWQQGVSGFLMGIMGVPFVARKASGKLGLTMMGGIKESINEYKEERKLRDLAVSNLNEYLGKPENAGLFKHMVLSLKYTDGMKKALETGDAKEYKDNEHKSLLATILAYHNANKIKDFYRMLDNVADISKYTPEQIEDLKNTAMTDEKGESIYKDKTTDEIKEIVTKNVEDIRKKAKDFIDMTNHLTVLYSDKFDNNSIANLAFNLSLSENQRERSIQLAQEVREFMNEKLEEGSKIINTNDLNAVLKSLEKFGKLSEIQTAFAELEKLKEEETKSKEEKSDTKEEEKTTKQESIYRQNIKEKTGLDADIFNVFISNLEAEAQKLVQVSGTKALGLETKILDLYKLIIDYKSNLKLYVQGVSNPTKYLETVAKYHADLLKEMHADKINKSGEIDDETKYTEFINGLEPKDREEFLKEHIKSNAASKPFAEKLLANDKLNEAANEMFSETNKEHTEEAKTALKQIFEANQTILTASIQEGLTKVEEEVKKLNNPDITKLLEATRAKIAKIQEIKSFYDNNTPGKTTVAADVKKLDTEEIRKLKEEAITSAKELISFRAEKTNNTELIDSFFKGKSALVAGKIPADYLNPADEENVTVDSKDKEAAGTKIKPSIKVVIDYATNTTKVYLVKASDGNIAQQTGDKFLVFAKNVKPVFEVKGWGITKEQFEESLRLAKVSISNMEDVIKSLLGRGSLKSSWTNVPVAGDEELQQNYSVIINKLNGEIETARTGVNTAETQPAAKPVDDFVLLYTDTKKGTRVGYKKSTNMRGDVEYTIHSKTKEGEDTRTLNSYFEMRATYDFISEDELKRLPDTKRNDKIKLHQIVESKTPSGDTQILAKILLDNGQLVTVKLNKNAITNRLAEKAIEESSKRESKFTGQWNFSVTEYDFRDEFTHQMAPTIIDKNNERDLFIYDMLKANNVFTFVNSGDLYRLWEKNKELPIKFKKINSDPTSSIHSVSAENGVYFMYIEVNGKEQIVGSVKQGSDIENKIKEAEAKGEEYIQTIRHFKAGDKGFNNKEQHSVADLTNSNNKPIIGLITLNADKSGPMLSTTGDSNISIDMIPGMSEQWDAHKGKPFLLLPAADGTYIFDIPSPNGLGAPKFMKEDSEGNLFLDYNAYPMIKRVHDLLKTISNIKVVKGEDVQNKSYDDARAAVKELNNLLRFSDPNNNSYKLDLYFSKETGDYFLSLHEDGNSNKRRMYQDELTTYKKYGNKITKAITPEAQIDSETPKIKSITELDIERRIATDQFASATLDANSAEYNYKQVLALLNAINPLFNFDKMAFENQPGEGITVNDWINNDLLDTTITLGRTYNGQFFLNDDTKGALVNSQKQTTKDTSSTYFTFGHASSTSKAFKIDYTFAKPVLIINSIEHANEKKLNSLNKLAGKGPVDKFNMKNSKDMKDFMNMLKEYLQLNTELSAFGEKPTDDEIYYFQIKIGDNMHYFKVTKETDAKGKFTYKSNNTIDMDKELFFIEKEMANEVDFEEVENNVEITSVEEPKVEQQPQPKQQPVVEIKEATAVFNYTDKFNKEFKVYNRSNPNKPLTLKEFVDKLETSKAPIEVVNNLIKDITGRTSKAALKQMGVTKEEALDLLDELNRYATAIPVINDNDNVDIICKKQ